MAKWKYPKPVNKTLRFGRFADVPIRNIPSDYLEWILREDVCPGPIKSVIELVLAQRKFAAKINKTSKNSKNKRNKKRR